jgi:sugar phosphate isomerase/epimerase
LRHQVIAGASDAARGPTPCITAALGPEVRRGPFVFHGRLASCLARAQACGFRAVEIFPPSAAALDERALRRGLKRHELTLAAVGTGAGYVLLRLHLLAANPRRRAAAVRFIRAVIDCAGALGAPAVIGSMKGSIPPGVGREAAEKRLAETLAELAERAAHHGTTLLLEPLNRYESNCINTLAEGAALIRKTGAANLRLLADCFHMNIEETSLPDAIRRANSWIGHVHFVDSNRRAAGLGHIDFTAVAAALRDIGYAGYLSAEALPLPSAAAAAKQTLAAFKEHFFPGPSQ